MLGLIESARRYQPILFDLQLSEQCKDHGNRKRILMTIHNSLSPIAFDIGPLSIRWYGLGFALAFLIGEWAVRKMIQREKLPDVDSSRLLISVLICTVLGARLVHCLVYDPAYYLSHPLKIFAIWEGGLASHGGVVGLIIGLAIASRALPTVSLTLLLDRISIPAAFGGAIVRLGNYANSEILGIPTSGPFGIVFDAVDQIARHPVQLYEGSVYLTLSGILLALYFRTDARSRQGALTGVFLIGVFSARLLLEPLKVPQAAYESGFFASVGQTLSVPFLIYGIYMLIRSSKRATAFVV